MQKLTCFKAYDIRGRLGDELNEEIAYRIGRAYGEVIKPKKVVIGADVRATSESLKSATIRGLNDAGVDVIDLGMTGTEEIYFATFFLELDGGIEITASHNPIDYNGMKLVKDKAQPISRESGLDQIQALAEAANFSAIKKQGQSRKSTVIDEYIKHILSYISLANITPLTLVVNAGNGAAGHVVDKLERIFLDQDVPIHFIKIHHQADASFPNGIPNPLLPENRSSTSKAVIEHNADFGIAWDGDFDRCFLFDEKGQFVEGYYIVGLLAEAFLTKEQGAKVIHDPRLTWNTIDIAQQCGGQAIQSQTGHAFIKERMRKEDAVYGGEMSAHHYFKGFSYCDSGMIPWLLVAELVCIKGVPLSTMLAQRIQAYPASGEINRTILSPQPAIDEVKAVFEGEAIAVDLTDGLSMEFKSWRFNLRMSNTEPLVRLNVESRADQALMEQKTKQILGILDNAK
ncbi:phosphomannomutase CpsG [Motilimonas pumila]|uniref:phosphomannomutase n=1 Tax=Motilimonas pumila TaxID=2303987 RepID=A0A418YDS0_9GAMM|nr:phosphomannomutase CpsG [Motilimonas pumila]RJG42696.1 phosphomannomutase CpsG [Motilimonas pumila]